MSIAHGLESRVPLLDHPLVEFAATIPADVRFKNGTMKHAFKEAFRQRLPAVIVDRQDKMGFPTSFIEWIKGEACEFVMDVHSTQAALNRNLVDNCMVITNLSKEVKYGRNIWGLLCLELWQQEFHDQASYYRNLILE